MKKHEIISKIRSDRIQTLKRRLTHLSARSIRLHQLTITSLKVLTTERRTNTLIIMPMFGNDPA